MTNLAMWTCLIAAAAYLGIAFGYEIRENIKLRRSFAVIGVTQDRRDYRQRCAARDLQQQKDDAVLIRDYEERVHRNPTYQRGIQKAVML